MAELDGPRLEPRSGRARQLVVFLHGYGADGNDLIDIGRAWQNLLPDAAFVSPHAPRPCGQAPMGREWFPLTFRDPGERWTGVNQAAPILEGFLDSELGRRDLPPSGLYNRILRKVEFPLITATLAATRGNQIRAADLLGLNRNTLRKKIRDLGIKVIRTPGN